MAVHSLENGEHAQRRSGACLQLLGMYTVLTLGRRQAVQCSCCHSVRILSTISLEFWQTMELACHAEYFLNVFDDSQQIADLEVWI